MAINVQFSDSSQTEVVSYFESPQDTSTFPNTGIVESDDARWAAFYNLVNGPQMGLPDPTSPS
jgi:hypothetical protein